MLGYWHDTVVCLSFHLSVTTCIVINDTSHSKCVWTSKLEVPIGTWFYNFQPLYPHYLHRLPSKFSRWPRLFQTTMNRLQSVQYAAARLVTGTRRSDHISPMLRQLHWLPVRQRVDFKVANLLRSCTSRWLAFRHRIWPTTAVLSPMLVSGDCVPQQAEHASWRGHTAPLAKDADLSYSEFRRSLKTFPFGQWSHGAV